MRGYVLLRSNPYMAKSDVNGRLEITNLPAGRHRFQLWHERAGYLRKMPFGSGTTDAKGRVTLTIDEGHNAIQRVALEPMRFDSK